MHDWRLYILAFSDSKIDCVSGQIFDLTADSRVQLDDPYTCVWIYILPLAQLTMCVWCIRATWPQNGGFGTHLHHNATDEISKRTDRID